MKMKRAIRNCLLAALAMFAALIPGAAQADVTVGFYSFELKVGLVTYFPHAFVTMKGTTKDGRVIDENIGFTAKSVSPAVLLGSVAGVTEVKDAKYIAKAERQFEIVVSDEQYAGIKAIAEKWKAIPGKSYNLNKRNCIHFVGEVGLYLGLKVDLSKDVIKKPRAFLRRMLLLNPQLVPLVPDKPSKSPNKAKPVGA